MSDVVDRIVAELIANTASYEQGFDRAIAKNDRFLKSVRELQKLGAAAPVGYADGLSKAATDGATAHEKAATRIKTARKGQTDAERAASAQEKQIAKDLAATVKAEEKAKADAAKQTARDAANAVKTAEREKQAAIKATQRAQEEAARYVGKSDGLPVGPGVRPVAITEGVRAPQITQQEYDAAIAAHAANLASRPEHVPPTPAGPSTGSVAEQASINNLLVEEAQYRAALVYANKEDAQILNDKLATITLTKRLQAQGVSDAQIALEVDKLELGIEKMRTGELEKQAALSHRTTRSTSPGAGRDAEQFARGAGFNAALGGTAAIAGIATAGIIAGVSEAVKVGLDYANALKVESDQLGITTKQLQIYQSAAEGVNVTNEQLREAFGQLSTNIGKAQEGAKEQSKIFGPGGLGVDLGNAKDGYKSLGDLLPTLVDRFSKVTDATRRHALETAAGGEQLRKLDPILAGGSASLDDLGDALQRTGALLSDSEIQNAGETAKKLKLIGDQLERDLTHTVVENRDAVLTLANAWKTAAQAALQYFSAATHSGNRDILDHPALVRAASLVTGADPDQTMFKAFKDNLVTAKDRADGLASVKRGIQQVKDSETSTNGSFYVDDIGGQANTASQREHVRRLLANRLRAISTAAAQDRSENAPSAPVQDGKPGNLNVFAPDPRKKRGKSAEQLDAEEQARTKQYQDQLAGFEADQLRAQEEMTGDIQRQADIEKQIADRALKKLIGDKKTGEVGDIELERRRNVDRGEDPAVARKRADDLVAAATKAHDADQQARDQQTLARNTAAQLAHAETQLAIDADLANSRLALAKTAKDRLAIELELLDNAKKTERANLDKQLSGLKQDDPARLDVQARIEALEKSTAAKAAVVRKQNQGPGATYLDTLPQTVDQVNEAFQNAEVQGLQAFDNGLTSVIAKFLHLNGIAGEFLESLIKIGIERELIAPIANSLFGPAQGGGSGGGGGGFLGSLLNIGSSFLGGGGGGISPGSISAIGNSAADSLNYLHFAGGGRPPVGKASIVGEKGQELFVPDSAGTIIPHDVVNAAFSNKRVSAPSGGNTVLHQTVNIDASGVNPEGYTKGILGIVQAETSKAIAQSQQQTLNATPGRLARQQTLGS